MRFLPVLIAVLVGACQPIPSTDAGDTAVSSPTSAAADCAARGGEMKPVGRAQTLQCVVTYADAGKRCTTGSDCLGDCRVDDAPFPAAGSAAVGRCQAESQVFGCYARLEDGKATPAICVD
ncbi:hypothetical protein [Brevundimonas sp. C43]|uniref:hypothetical protein n=1 Tax=Brevundimonas sp. C43 TaxID=3068314 RepID=UPI00273D4631|nr:hypothetical protein [Brevundimonas sp. C43]